MKKSGIVARAWNNTPIQRRVSDDYVNATAMCKANSKRWNDYFETDRCHGYLAALSGSTGIPVDQLFHKISTGPNDGRGTYVHPQVAVDLARWISAPFAVWMDAWFLEELDRKQASQARGARKPLPLDRKGAEIITARRESNVGLGSMSKEHGLPYAATHQVRNNHFWKESTDSLKERAGTSKWHDRADLRSQMLTWYCNDKIMEEAEAREEAGAAMTLKAVKAVSKNVRSVFEQIEGTDFRVRFMSASISPGRASRMLSQSADCDQGSLF
jgi:hypothetical protein